MLKHRTFMGKIFSRTISGVLLLVGSSTLLAAEKVIKLEGSQVRIEWKNSDLGWQIAEAAVASNKAWLSIGEGCGSYTYLYATKVSKPLVPIDYGHSACTFYPKNAAASDKGVAFSDSTPEAEITSEWCIDEKLPSHIRVKLRLVAKKEGYYSLSTPSLTAIDQAELAWGMIPGAWYGRKLQPDRELALAYSQGIPDRPALSFEANTMTLCGIMSSRNGVTLGVAPEPGTAADPWPGDSMDRDTKQVGISLMDRHMRLGPVLYYPIHGERKSYLKAGESVELAFRFILAKSDWFPVYKSVAEDMYHFSDLLPLQQSEQSLAERVERMQTMLVNPQEACWNTLTLDNTEIGMYGSKNSDLGAMLMLAKTSPQSATFNSRMPLVRAFKLEQQEMTAGFFQGAAVGEYPVNPATGMAGDGKFVSEVGNWVEPLYTTIYTLCDVGNMLLFNPGDTLLRDRVRAAGDRLLAWQHPDGGFDVAYDRVTHALVFPHLKDYRPTWYGLLVAHRILGDPKYLAAARRGADWFVTNAVNQGYFLGACGDSLNKWDFTTAQSAQALLDLYETTKDLKYRDAAVRTAELYATSIFTHPVASAAVKMVNGTARQDWEITQTGLGVEHIRGTAAASGPIYLASHAGLFVRIFHLTGEKLFLDMARCRARAERRRGLPHW
ncbi:MAG: hypothetical protein WDM96_00265 [Lacunisphaera sp.]